MSHRPDDERSRLIQELLQILGPEGVELLARNRDATLRLVARLKARKLDERVPDAAVNAIEMEAAARLAAGQPGPLFARLDFARDRIPYWRIIDRGERELVSSKTWKGEPEA